MNREKELADALLDNVRILKSRLYEFDDRTGLYRFLNSIQRRLLKGELQRANREAKKALDRLLDEYDKYILSK